MVPKNPLTPLSPQDAVQPAKGKYVLEIKGQQRFEKKLCI